MEAIPVGCVLVPLAFAGQPTARLNAGAGATYVLLRRERRRSPFEVLQGAKRRD